MTAMVMPVEMMMTVVMAVTRIALMLRLLVAVTAAMIEIAGLRRRHRKTESRSNNQRRDAFAEHAFCKHLVLLVEW